MDYKAIAIITILLAFTFTKLASANPDYSGSRYLHKPTGTYNVGYKRYHLINLKACPNSFFKESNKDSFSDINPLHCNEIELAVYYPTKKVGSSPYYPIPSLIADIQTFSTNVSESNIEHIKAIRSHSGINLPIVDKKFPVVFFSPGYGLPTQEYENTLTELASNGYIVVGVNSQFINGNISFNNTKIASVIEPETDEDKKDFFRNGYADFSYVYDVLSQKKLKDPVLNNISWNKFFLLGHSLGAAIVARFASYPGILAVATLDLTIDLLEGNDCHPGLKTPFMHIFSSQMYLKSDNKKFPYLCKKNESMPYKNIVVISGNNNPLYSMHMNFCDYSTLQYEPSIMSALNQLRKKPDTVFLGTGNGNKIVEQVNKKLLNFFSNYL